MNLNLLGSNLLDLLQQRGWSVQHSVSREPLLPPDLRKRYPRVPIELISFLETIDSCVSADETVWFLCREDYRRTDDTAFRWNEFELMALESDAMERQKEASKFWDRHFPFMLAVHSDYDYLAVSLDERSYGQVVHGCGPEFEEPLAVAPSFVQFLALFSETATGRRDDYPLSCFL